MIVLRVVSDHHTVLHIASPYQLLLLKPNNTTCTFSKTTLYILFFSRNDQILYSCVTNFLSSLLDDRPHAGARPLGSIEAPFGDTKDTCSTAQGNEER